MTKEAKILVSAIGAIVLTFAISMLEGAGILSRNACAALQFAVLLVLGVFIIYLSVSKKNQDEADAQLSGAKRFARALPGVLVLLIAAVNTLKYLDFISSSMSTLLTGIAILAMIASWWFMRKRSS